MHCQNVGWGLPMLSVNHWFVISMYLRVLLHIYHMSSWWRHDMETLSALLVICEGIPPVTGDTFSPSLAFCEGVHRSPVDYPHKKPVMWSFGASFDASLHKCFNIRWIFRWFDTSFDVTVRYACVWTRVYARIRCMCMLAYYINNDVPRASWCLKSPTIWLCVQRLFGLTTKKTGRG